jgi:predicted Rossmann fold flavoprotein
MVKVMQLQKASTVKNAAKDKTIWDVVVIGGGPAGMMAAGTAAASGAKVLLLEKNASVGKKLLITGGGRCNVTNAELDTRTLLSKFAGKDRKDDQFLFSTFSKWNVQDTLDFFHGRGMETKVEALQRVFPLSNSAQSVWDVLVNYIKEGNVTVRTKAVIKKFKVKENVLQSLTLSTGQEIQAKAFILATGGKSHPETGSTGDGFAWLGEFGHSISESNAALVPITLKDTWAKDLAGITLPNIQLTLLQEGEKQRRVKGRLLFTHKGATGPTILNMSKEIGQLLSYGPVVIELDLVPSIAREELDTQLHAVLKDQSNKLVKNVLSEFLSSKLIPSALVAPLLALSEIPADTFAHSLTREKRIELTHLLKAVPLNVKGLHGLDKAVITSGGVALTEIDFRTMQSRIAPNLYIIGDLLDLDRPSGGYSLQICWTTGAVAGKSAASATTNR